MRTAQRQIPEVKKMRQFEAPSRSHRGHWRSFRVRDELSAVGDIALQHVPVTQIGSPGLQFLICCQPSKSRGVGGGGRRRGRKAGLRLFAGNTKGARVNKNDRKA